MDIYEWISEVKDVSISEGRAGGWLRHVTLVGGCSWLPLEILNSLLWLTDVPVSSSTVDTMSAALLALVVRIMWTCRHVLHPQTKWLCFASACLSVCLSVRLEEVADQFLTLEIRTRNSVMICNSLSRSHKMVMHLRVCIDWWWWVVSTSVRVIDHPIPPNGMCSAFLVFSWQLSGNNLGNCTR